MKRVGEMFKNKRLVLVIIVIAVVVVFSVYTWTRAVYWTEIQIEMLEMYEGDESSSNLNFCAMTDWAIKKIAIFAGILFTSTFLLLKVIPNKKEDLNRLIKR